MNFKILIIFLFVFLTNLSACRLWALCTKAEHVISSLPHNEKTQIIKQLEAMFYQSVSNPNGWAFLNYDSTLNFNNISVYRSHLPAYSDSAIYWNKALTMIDSGHNRIGIGHIRLASSGVNDIPNPHPWVFKRDSINYSLVHNGTVDKTKLYNLLTNYDTDFSWLNEHNPNTFGDNSWISDEGWSRVVDSELLLLLIMKNINESNDILNGLKSALSMLLNLGVRANQMNIVFSNGFDLYAFGGLNGLSIFESFNYIAVMTQPVNYDDYSNLVWSSISDKEMIHINEKGLARYPNFIQQINDNDENFNLYFNIKSPYPNPFNAELTIPYNINVKEKVNISIFSILGERIYNINLNQEQLDKGYIKWTPIKNSKTIISSGTYIIKAESKTKSASQKILFIK